jgi:hypothetical protein
MVARPRSHYDVLGVDSSASLAQVKSAFRRKCLQLHPDVSKGRSTEVEFMEPQKAYDLLSARLISDGHATGHHASGYESLIKTGDASYPASPPPMPVACEEDAPLTTFCPPPHSASSWFRTASMESSGEGMPSQMQYGSSYWDRDVVEMMGSYRHFSGPVTPQPARAVMAAAYAAGKRRWF